MICGALQTLNEEACEDVLEEKDEAPEHENNDVPITFIVPPSPDQSSQQGDLNESIVTIFVDNTKDSNISTNIPPPIQSRSKEVSVIIECTDDNDESPL